MTRGRASLGDESQDADGYGEPGGDRHGGEAVDQRSADRERPSGASPVLVVYARRGWAFISKDDLTRAEADLDKALDLSPGDDYAVRGRAEVYQRQNKPVPETLSTGLHFDKFRRLM